MGDLNTINQSGDLDELSLDGINVREEIVKAITDGVFTPSIPASAAANSSIFFNTDTGRLSWKSPAGILMRFRMQLES